MHRDDRWYCVSLDGRTMVLVQGWKDASNEARRLREANPGATVLVENIGELPRKEER